ncbi:hypothetical protein LNP05_06915 [Klebsiella pneumoniae subsp. pneumoniae]|nr:hypothetical protein [Klebsiella pneumoniae subsp. pneumoniae]
MLLHAEIIHAATVDIPGKIRQAGFANLMDYFAVTLQKCDAVQIFDVDFSAVFIDTFLLPGISRWRCTLLALFSLAVRVFRQIPPPSPVATGPETIK